MPAAPSEVSILIAEALKTLRAPRVRGPFPYPTDAELARPDYLRELARWSRQTVVRSRRTLGARGVAEALAAADWLDEAADLLAAPASGPRPVPSPARSLADRPERRRHPDR